MKFTGCSPSWNDVKIIYRENKFKKRKFKEAARIILHNKEQLLKEKDEKKAIFNLWNILLNSKADYISSN